MNITVRDTATGREVEFAAPDPYDVSDGNLSCDCNRSLLFGEDAGKGGVCAGHKRFIVVATDDPFYFLAELNQSYPEDLLRKNGIE